MIVLSEYCEVTKIFVVNTDDNTAIASYPFPGLYWWVKIFSLQKPALNHRDIFTKNSYHNRFYLATAQGKIGLSIPVKKGRNQKTPIREVAISYAENWQQQHWRTLQAAYNRSPFFEYYEAELKLIYKEPFQYLFDFNKTSIQWLCKQLGVALPDEGTTTDAKPGIDAINLLKPNAVVDDRIFPVYHQVFQDRHGFIANLSLLDLLFNEGNYASAYLRTLAQSTSI